MKRKTLANSNVIHSELERILHVEVTAKTYIFEVSSFTDGKYDI